MTRDDALRLALEALEDLTDTGFTRGPQGKRAGDAIAAIREALEQPEMVPAFRSSYAYSVGFKDGQAAQQPAKASTANPRECVDPMCACRGGPCAECPEGERETLEQTTIPAGYALVPVEPTPAMCDEGAQAIVQWEDGAKWPESWGEPYVTQYRKEVAKSYRAMVEAAPQPAEQPQQEPVAQVKVMKTGGSAGIATRIVEIDDPRRERLLPGTLLYTTPPRREWVGLTEAEIAACHNMMDQKWTTTELVLHVQAALKARNA